jgi:YHS domain-containing protein
MRRLKVLAGLLAAVVMTVAAASYFAPSANGAQSAINTLGTNGVAIKGYDPVAYFTEGAPHKGKPEFTVMHNGVKWRFASAENKALFEANPEKYIPAYGGYCAFGVSQGYLVKIEPDAWSIRNGKLYLNYDKSVQKKWARKPATYIKQADKNWPGLVAKN